MDSLNFGGRPKRYPTRKSRINASITPEGIDGLDALARSLYSSRSELLEKIGRGELLVFNPKEALSLGKLSKSFLPKNRQNFAKLMLT
jgi:hypothetical protein